MRMKVRVSLVPFLFLAAAPASLVGQTPPPVPIRVLVGDVALVAGPATEPFLENGLAMVPVQPLLQAMGATVQTHQGEVTALQGCQSLNIKPGDTALQVNGRAQSMPLPARSVDGELFVPLRSVAEALNVTVDWDARSRTAVVSPPAPRAAEGERALITLQVRRTGTLTLPAQLREGQSSLRVRPGTQAWILDPRQTTYTWTFAPADGGPAQSLSVRYDGEAFRSGPDTADLTALLQEADFSALRALTLPPGFRSVRELCRLPRLTRLTIEQGLDYSPDVLHAVLKGAPGLKELELTGPDELPRVPGTGATYRFPYRLETPHGIFLGDRGMSILTLARYAKAFESTAVGELERDTGLRPTTKKPVFLLYGDQATWNERAANPAVLGYYTAQDHRIHMAHWKTPESVNTLLLAHEFFHWLAWEEGKVNLPIWLNEGLAHNLSWRVEQHADSWLNPYVRREWLRIANNPNLPVPALSSHTAQDEFTITAVGHLLQTRGRDALVPFFERTRAGISFSEAFELSFGLTTAEFEAEYQRQVKELRRGR